MKVVRLSILPLLILTIASIYGCKTVKKGWNNLNVFALEDDIRLGAQVAAEIAQDRAQFPVLSESGANNQKLYSYVRGITTKILNSGKVKYKNEFKWQVKIIDDANTLNAFCTPGGYIYVYTGLIKFLDTEDQLAGVIGHEIAHADKRHSTKQMTKSLGLQILADAALGNKDALKQVIGGLLSLKFSRTHETEADTYSVIYLCPTQYNAAGAAGFFKKMMGQGGAPPEFMSTHPSSGNRVENIEAQKVEQGCKGKKTNKTAYDNIKKLIQ